MRPTLASFNWLFSDTLISDHESDLVDLTVIIATCRPIDLAGTLESLSNCVLPANFAQTIVIENGTPEPTLEAVIHRSSPKLKIAFMHCREGNKSNALNQAIDSLQDNQLLFLTDDDVQFDKNVLVQYAEAAADFDANVVFGGVIVPDRHAPPPPELASYLPESMSGFPKQGDPMDLATVVFIGPNWAVFSDDVKRLGGFDPRFGPGSKLRSTGQESQMMRTMRKAGFKFVFVEKAIVRHKIEPENYTVEFIADRYFRIGVEIGQNVISKNPFADMLRQAKLFLKGQCVLTALPVMRLLVSHGKFLEVLTRAQYSRGILTGWRSQQ